MPNQVTLKELKIIAKRLSFTIHDASYSQSRRVKGTWFKYETHEQFVWEKKPNLDNVVAYYTLVDVHDEEKEVQKYPAKIKYIHWTDMLLFQLDLSDTIADIQRKAIKLDEADEAYLILKHM